MASRAVPVLKFVGTVSLGLLTGLSYSLTTQTVPTLLSLPSAATAAQAFQTLTESAKKHLRNLTRLSGCAFALAYLLSPRPYRHPYLLYTSVLVLTSDLATSEALAPYVLPQSFTYSSDSVQNSGAARKRRTPATRARMEASYEVLPSASGSDVHSDGTGGSVSGEEHEGDEDTHAESINGEEVRAKVEVFLKKQIVWSVVAATAFVMSIVGIWGDGVAAVRSTVIIEV